MTDLELKGQIWLKNQNLIIPDSTTWDTQPNNQSKYIIPIAMTS